MKQNTDLLQSLQHELQLSKSEKKDLYEILQLREREIQDFKNELISIKRQLDIETKKSVQQRQEFDKKYSLMQSQSEMVKSKAKQFIEVKNQLQMQLELKQKECYQKEEALQQQYSQGYTQSQNSQAETKKPNNRIMNLILRKQQISYYNKCQHIETDFIEVCENNDQLQRLVVILGGITAFSLIFGCIQALI